MSLDGLLAALGRDADVRAEDVLARARADAAAIDSETEIEVDRRRREHLGRFEEEYRARTARDLAALRREAAGVVYAARAEFLGKLFDAVRAALPATAAGPEYRAVLRHHVDEALSYVRPAPAVVRVPPSLSDAIAEVLGSEPDVRVELDSTMEPGVIVEAADGSVTVDNTLAARLARLEPDLAIEVLPGDA